jgi:hypothetical protein
MWRGVIALLQHRRIAKLNAGFDLAIQDYGLDAVKTT